jgi:hypothetical protein
MSIPFRCLVLLSTVVSPLNYLHYLLTSSQLKLCVTFFTVISIFSLIDPLPSVFDIHSSRKRSTTAQKKGWDQLTFGCTPFYQNYQSRSSGSALVCELFVSEICGTCMKASTTFRASQNHQQPQRSWIGTKALFAYVILIWSSHRFPGVASEFGRLFSTA